MKSSTTKNLAAAAFALGIFWGVSFNASSVVGQTTDAAAFDAAATYKAKCQMCHTPTASKSFDATKADEELVAIVLKGKKPEAGPAMPAYETKGVTEDQAKAMVAFMKSIKK
jgi:mono/diheme cytochrome c family protein